MTHLNNQKNDLSTDKLYVFYEDLKKVKIKLEKGEVKGQPIILSTLSKMVDYQIFIIIGMMDVLVVSKSLIDASIEWEKQYFSRQSIHINHEILRVINVHKKPLREIIKAEYQDLFEDLKKVNQEIMIFNKKANHIKNYRHSITGHYDANLNALIENMGSLDDKKALEDLVSLFELLQGSFIFNRNVLKMVQLKIKNN